MSDTEKVPGSVYLYAIIGVRVNVHCSLTAQVAVREALENVDLEKLCFSEGQHGSVHSQWAEDHVGALVDFKDDEEFLLSEFVPGHGNTTLRRYYGKEGGPHVPDDHAG